MVAQFRPNAAFRPLPELQELDLRTGPVILSLLFFGGLSLSLDGGCGFYKSVHAAPYGSWTPRIGFMSSVFFDDVHGVKPDFKNYRIAGVTMPIIGVRSMSEVNYSQVV